MLSGPDAVFPLSPSPSGPISSSHSLLVIGVNLYRGELYQQSRGPTVRRRVWIAVGGPRYQSRNLGLAGEDDRWDFGSGASFYVDATESPWAKHYQMYSYITEELPALIAENFPVDATRQSIFGHSMGGHGALVCALRHPSRYQSVSAFAPIAAPMSCPWGETAFRGYLGENRQTWLGYDASELVKTSAWEGPILIDQGEADSFLGEGQLLPERFEAACQQAGVDLRLRRQPGYDHSYYFIASFMEDHLRHHAEALDCF